MSCPPERLQFLRHLKGRGVEFGPGLKPIPKPEFVDRIEYCDAHDRDDMARFYPEIAGQVDLFPEKIHYRLDLNRGSFERVFGGKRFDFVIFCHIMEHMADPLRILGELNRLLVPDGILWVTIPDPREWKDRTRPTTPIAETVRRHEEQATEPSREIVQELIWHWDGERIPIESERFEELYRIHVKRSIHVNVWLPVDFLKVLEYSNTKLGTTLELIDGGCSKEEYTFILRNTPAGLTNLIHPALANRILATRARLESPPLGPPTPEETAEVREKPGGLLGRLKGKRSRE